MVRTFAPPRTMFSVVGVNTPITSPVFAAALYAAWTVEYTGGLGHSGLAPEDAAEVIPDDLIPDGKVKTSPIQATASSE